MTLKTEIFYFLDNGFYFFICFLSQPHQFCNAEYSHQHFMRKRHKYFNSCSDSAQCLEERRQAEPLHFSNIICSPSAYNSIMAFFKFHLSLVKIRFDNASLNFSNPNPNLLRIADCVQEHFLHPEVLTHLRPIFYRHLDADAASPA